MHGAFSYLRIIPFLLAVAITTVLRKITVQTPDRYRFPKPPVALQRSGIRFVLSVPILGDGQAAFCFESCTKVFNI